MKTFKQHIEESFDRLAPVDVYFNKNINNGRYEYYKQIRSDLYKFVAFQYLNSDKIHVIKQKPPYFRERDMFKTSKQLNGNGLEYIRTLTGEEFYKMQFLENL